MSDWNEAIEAAAKSIEALALTWHDKRCHEWLLAAKHIRSLKRVVNQEDGGFVSIEDAEKYFTRGLVFDTWSPKEIMQALNRLKRPSVSGGGETQIHLLEEIASAGFYLAQDSMKKLDEYIERARKITGYNEKTDSFERRNRAAK